MSREEKMQVLGADEQGQAISVVEAVIFYARFRQTNGRICESHDTSPVSGDGRKMYGSQREGDQPKTDTLQTAF